MLKSLLQFLVLNLKIFLYEIKYYWIGTMAIADDVASKHKNVCAITDCTGQVAVVTGGARGIGSSLVKELLKCNMIVIVGCRNVRAGEEKVKQFRNEGISSGQVHIYPLDLMSFKSVKLFAETVTANHDAVHLLVNNAGIMFPSYQLSDDGFESQWSVNFLAPALLTHLMLPLLKKGSDQSPSISTRIVNVTSCAHAAATSINYGIDRKMDYIPSRSYAQSKLAQILLTIELDRQLKNAGYNISVHAVHPGLVNTDLFDGTILKKLPCVLKYVCKNVEEGACTVLYACISPHLNGMGGLYLSNCQSTTPSKLALCEMQQRRLYNYTLQTLGISEF